MRTKKLLLIALVFIYACDKDESIIPGQNAYNGYTLEWSDEFDDPFIDSNNWAYELGDGTDYGLKSGWGN
ncbi:MAG: hypothetical protein MK310_10410, partial [Rhodobacterales bacterium]|nr:hypothetical protein [Rhodobacterales bacterium]